jgi:hypothetical protein
MGQKKLHEIQGMISLSVKGCQGGKIDGAEAAVPFRLE